MRHGGLDAHTDEALRIVEYLKLVTRNRRSGVTCIAAAEIARVEPGAAIDQ